MRLFAWLVVATLLHGGAFLLLKPGEDQPQANLLKSEQTVQLHLKKNNLSKNHSLSFSEPEAEKQADPTPTKAPSTNTVTPVSTVAVATPIATPITAPATNKKAPAPKPTPITTGVTSTLASLSDPKSIKIIKAPSELSKKITGDLSTKVKKEIKSEPIQLVSYNSDETQPNKATLQQHQKQPLKTNNVTFISAQPVSFRKPKYPKRAIIRNQQGHVSVQLSILKNGDVEAAELLESSGYRILDNSVLHFVEDEKFIPAIKNGFPIASIQIFSFRFILN